MAAAAGLEAVGRLDAAEKAYRVAAERWPDAALPALGLANVAAARGDWQLAEHRYRDVAAGHPAQATALNNRAEALRRLGCPNLARAILVQGLQEIPRADSLRPVLEGTLQQIEADALAQPADAPRCSAYAAGR
jgi:tetratricopeptide (TPR) repeat protein